MNILGIDTSSRVLALAFSSKKELVWETNLVYKFRHLEKVFVLIDNALKTLRWKTSDIDMLVCGLGPGSFTGLRIGLATVK